MLGLLGGLVSGLFGLGGQSMQIQAQSKENEKAFERNKQLAQIQNQYNIDQWNRANNYNLPINQIKRLKEAGLSPALMYTNGASGLTATQSPSMSAGTPYQPVDHTLGGNRKTIGDAMNTALDFAHRKAIIDNINKDTELKQSQRVGTDLTNSTILDMSAANLRVTLANAGFKEEETKNIIAERDNIVKNGQLIDENILTSIAQRDNITFEQWLKQQELQLNKDETQARIREISSKCNLNDAQTRQLKESLPLIIQKLGNEVYNTGAQGELLAGEIILQASEQILMGNEVTLSNLTTRFDADKLKDKVHLRERFSGAYYLGQAISDLLNSTTSSVVSGVVSAIK